MVGYFALRNFVHVGCRLAFTDYGFIVFAFSYLGVGQFGSPPRLGRGSRGFKSLHPDLCRHRLIGKDTALSRPR